MAGKERRFLDKSWARAVESFDDVPIQRLINADICAL